MSDLPDTPFCRVLPSGHEVHYWDKSGNECLCGLAAKLEKPRGVCPVCGGKFQLGRQGTLRHHLGNERGGYSGVWREKCKGVGQEPVKAGDPT